MSVYTHWPHSYIVQHISEAKLEGYTTDFIDYYYWRDNNIIDLSPEIINISYALMNLVFTNIKKQRVREK